MDERILHHLKDCHEIWHAGDIGDLAVTDQLAEIATVKAVYGNIDNHIARSAFGLNAIFEIEGLKVFITHIAGRPGKYPTRVYSEVMTEKPDIFVCGHSHICLIKKTAVPNLLHINPGAAGKHGFHKVRTLVRMTLSPGKVDHIEVVELGSK
jgi:putative phosphoesterase